MLSAETKELLEDFEKRMKFINIVKYITAGGMTATIRTLFDGNTDRLDNLIVMVMIFIMDHTLRNNENCGRKDIENFLGEVLEFYGIEKSYSQEITDYIMTDVLQNGGKQVGFDVFSWKSQQFESMTCRIVSELNGSYKLTDEAYDFLFRTKEIDSELDFSVSRFKLNEFIKRGNYSKALNQSRELVSRVRALKTSMDDFMIKCRENISSVSVDEYDDIIAHISSVFSDEQKELDDIRNVVSSRLEKIIDSIQRGQSVPNAARLENEIEEILRNIDITISEQSRVYNKKYSLSESYGKQLDEDFTYFTTKRFSIEKEILLPAQKLNSEDGALLSQLFYPLYKPAFKRFFSIASFYNKQQKLRDRGSDDYIDINIDTTVDDKALIRNQRFTEIISLFFTFSSDHRTFCMSEFVSDIDAETLSFICEENALFSVILKLYAFGEIDVEKWKKHRSNIIVPSGEFDLSYCMNELSDELLKMSEITITKGSGTLEVTLENTMKISLSEFDIEVKYE